MTPIAYIAEEVKRQGHHLDEPEDGLIRVCWMREAWNYATRLSQMYEEKPNFYSIIKLGRLVEQEKNRNGLRRVGVRVGLKVCPAPELVPTLLHTLCATGVDLTPLEFYKELLEIHPFVDGNGRTGKVVLNWLNNSLDNPIFPPNNFWGPTILNP